MDLSVIKQILSLAGIKNLAVTFDVSAQQINATFIKDSQMRTAHITFADIESIFTELPSEAAAAPPQGKTPPEGC